MILHPETARKTADLLLQINAIKLNPGNPFLWASGWKSPIYCDNRIMLSYVAVRTYVAEQMAQQIKNTYPHAQVIAGVATGAIGVGMLVAQILALPFVYVRPEPKSHGRKNQIEGSLEPGSSVVVIEDLISTGKSSLLAVEALKASGADVLGMIAIFTYGFEHAQQAFDAQKVTLHTLSDYAHLIELAVAQGVVDHNAHQTLLDWRKNPAQWGQ